MERQELSLGELAPASLPNLLRRQGEHTLPAMLRTGPAEQDVRKKSAAEAALSTNHPKERVWRRQHEFVSSPPVPSGHPRWFLGLSFRMEAGDLRVPRLPKARNLLQWRTNKAVSRQMSDRRVPRVISPIIQPTCSLEKQSACQFFDKTQSLTYPSDY